MNLSRRNSSRFNFQSKSHNRPMTLAQQSTTRVECNKVDHNKLEKSKKDQRAVLLWRRPSFLQVSFPKKLMISLPSSVIKSVNSKSKRGNWIFALSIMCLKLKKGSILALKHWVIRCLSRTILLKYRFFAILNKLERLLISREKCLPTSSLHILV